MRSSPVFGYYTGITPHMIILLKSPTVKGFTANNLRGSVRYLRQRLERRIVCGSAAMACSTDRSVDGTVCAAARAVAHAVRLVLGGAPDDLCVSLRRMVRRLPGGCPTACVTLRQMVWIEAGPAYCPKARSCRFGERFDACAAACPTACVYRFGGWCGPGRAWRTADGSLVSLVGISSADLRFGGSRDNCITGKIR